MYVIYIYIYIYIICYISPDLFTFLLHYSVILNTIEVVSNRFYFYIFWFNFSKKKILIFIYFYFFLRLVFYNFLFQFYLSLFSCITLNK